jgi:hypothetical protein
VDKVHTGAPREAVPSQFFGVVGVAGAVIAVLLAIPEYRLKAESQRATNDVELARLFAQLVPTATGEAPF